VIHLLQYPSHFELRKVACDKAIKWLDQRVFVSKLLVREYIGFEEVADGEWSVYSDLWRGVIPLSCKGSGPNAL
jgi:hypothetical protein